MGKIRVLYFTAQQLHLTSNGGALCGRNHVRRLMQDPEVELLVVVAAVPEDCGPAREYLASIGVDHLVLSRRTDNLHQEKLTPIGALKFAWKAMTHFNCEMVALNQHGIGQTVLDWASVYWKADIVVVEYLYSALFCEQLFQSSHRVAIVTLNREEQFYRDLMRLGLVQHGRLTGAISARRLGAFERRIYRRSDIVISLGPPDLPPYLPACRKRCITPYLDERSEKWTYADSKSVFFVGNIGHYPNKLAVENIATRLAPLVSGKRPDIRFKIVGASLEDVPSDWRHAQVDYLGVADGETVDRLFRSADVLLCPIQNNFSIKFKAVEAISYGTPLLASTETLEGLPHIAGLPRLDLARPLDTANLICDLVGSCSKLTQLSRTILAQARVFMNSQATVWSDVLRGAASLPNNDVLYYRRSQMTSIA